MNLQSRIPATCRKLFCVLLSAGAWIAAPVAYAEPPRVTVLFLGDNGPHRPVERFRQIQPVLEKRGVQIAYTDNVKDLNPQTLSRYDALLLYANIDRIEAAEERALLEYVAGGGGFVPVHCASYCFRNSPKLVELMGGQFKSHGTGVFRPVVGAPEHPVMKGFGEFESWDETYVHTLHNEKDRTVLSYRVDAGGKEPWTWVRTHGKGRVFYTAWGHDGRTWGHPGFANLLERGIRWAAGGDPGVVPAYADPTEFEIPAMTAVRKDVKPFEYVEAKIAFYPPGGDRKGGGAWNKMQLPLEPAESRKHFVTPVGFRVEVFAAEPQIGKPICMAWDERGRLWIAETVDYPNELQPEGAGRDRITICEDTDGDGRADKFTRFAEKLSIPTSLAFAHGGIIVQQPPHTLFLRDTNGDDRADERIVLFTGWNTGDTHAGPNNLQYGLDNWMWGMLGYAGFNGTVGGEKHTFGQGFYRFKVGAVENPSTKTPPAANGANPASPLRAPTVSELEFLRSTNNNTWGIGFSEEGLVFASTANRNPSVYLPIPNRYYEAVRGWSAGQLGTIADTHLFQAATDKIRQVDHHGGYTAAAGHALYTARTYPQAYWNRTAFVCDPTGHLVGTFVLKRDGSDFHSTNLFNLFASDDEWSAPIMAEVGPDGNVWVIDWYNYIVQHNPTPAGFQTGKGNAYETDLRDKKHGRIYRVVYEPAERSVEKRGQAPSDGRDKATRSRTDFKSVPREEPMTLGGASPQQLVETLKHDNLLWRKHAQRLLVERGRRDVVPALIALAGDSSSDAIGLNVGAIHALWTMHGLGALDGSDTAATAAAVAALKHPSAGVRRNALAVLPRNANSVNAILASGALEDADPHVRVAALLALSEIPRSPEAGRAVATFLQKPQNDPDRWMIDAATSAAAAHDLHFLKAVVDLSAMKATTPAGSKTTAAINEKSFVTMAIVSEHYARGGPVDSVAPLLSTLSQANRAVADAIVGGLSKGWPRDRKVAVTAEFDQTLAQVFDQLSPGTQGQLIKLAATWGSQTLERHAAAIAKSLLSTAADDDQPEDKRLQAARQVIAFRPGDAELIEELLELVSPRSSPAFAAGIIDAVGASESPAVGAALVEHLAGQTPSVRAAALRVLLARPEWTQTLLKGVEQAQVQIAELTLDQKQSLAAHPDRAIAERAKKLLAQGGGLPNPDRQKVLAELMPLTKQTGDAELGKQVFKQQCAKCHTHSGEGTKVGPDLTGVAVHPKAELLTHIIDPSRSVEGNYRAYTVVTEEGRVLNGLLAGESKTAIELFDAEGKKHLVLREEIEQLIVSPKSLMPDGFEKQVPPEAIANLLEFLTKRGKFLPLPLDKAATIVSTRGMFYREDADAERLIFSDWSPKTFEGVPFLLVDPRDDRIPNVILLHGPQGTFPPKMPKSVRLPCNAPAKAVHLLSGVSGWGFPLGEKGSVSLIVRLHYADGQAEDHPLANGIHFADYIRRVDVPESKLAFMLRNQQIRYLAVHPKRPEAIREIEFVKGPDNTAPVVMAVTVEGLEG